jgi:hypothetical protein
MDHTATGKARKGNIRTAGFAQIEKPTISDPRLTATAFRILAFLLAQAKGSGVALASVAQMMKAIGKSRRTVQNAIKLLASLRYLTVVKDDDFVVGRVFKIDVVTPLAAQDAAQAIGMDPAELVTVPPMPGALDLPPKWPARAGWGRAGQPDGWTPPPAPVAEPAQVVTVPPEPVAQVEPGVQKIAPPRATSCTQIVQIREREKEQTEDRDSSLKGPNDLRPLTLDYIEQVKAECELIERIKAVGRRTPPDDLRPIAASMARMLRDTHSIPNHVKWLRMQADGSISQGMIGEAFRSVLAAMKKRPIPNPGGYFETSLQGRFDREVQVQRDRLQAHRDRTAAATPTAAQEPASTMPKPKPAASTTRRPESTPEASRSPGDSNGYTGAAARVHEELAPFRNAAATPPTEAELAELQRKRDAALADLAAYRRSRPKPPEPAA